MAAVLDPERLRSDVEAARFMLQSGHAGRSARSYRRLLRRIESSADQRAEVLEQYARVLFGLAAVELEISGALEVSMQLLDQAERVAAGLTAGALTASIRGQRGWLLLRSGHSPDALAAFDSALEMFDSAEPHDQMTILLNRGVLHLEHGRLDLAAADLGRCVAIAGTDDDYWHLEMKARHNLGYVDFLAGRVPAALAAMERAEQLNRAEQHPMALLDRARVLREAGLVDEADRLLGDAADLFRRARLHQDLAETELARAECALTVGDHRGARRHASSAHRRFARRGNVRWQRKAELLLLRCERRALDERSERARRSALLVLATRAELLAAACRDEGRADLAQPADLLAADCQLHAGRDHTATLTVRRADPLQLRLQTREVRALEALRRGDRGRAAAEVREGLRELGSYQDRFGSLDLRTAAAVHGVPLARLGLDAALAGGSPAEVFAAVERARAISIRMAPVRPPSDEATAQLLADLRQVEETVRGLEGDPAGRSEADRLHVRAARLQRRIRWRSWELEATGRAGVRSGARVSDVRAASRAGRHSFISYVGHHGRLLAVRATGRVMLFELGSTIEVAELGHRVHADLDALAMPALPTALRAAVLGSLRRGLERLDEILLRPLRSDGRPLVVSATGPLAVLPWNLLPSRQGLPVVVTPSATAWLDSIGDRRPDRPTLAAVAGPGLRRAEREAGGVRAGWGRGSLLVDDAASTSAVREALTRADVVHVAAHGSHRQDSPLFSSIRLADGPLFAYELDTGPGIAGCVTLSACDTGLITLRPGDEGLGLTSVLVHLGVRSVLAGVAKIADDTAADVMETVHRQLARGTDSASALALALAGTDPEAPAPFGCFGGSW